MTRKKIMKIMETISILQQIYEFIHTMHVSQSSQYQTLAFSLLP
jgi:hypothetical protein